MQTLKQKVGIIAELLLILLWSAWVGRVYLDFNPSTWPSLTDFALNLPGYYSLSLIGKCGLCFAWNGSINGGNPTMVELLASFTHPLVILMIGLFGFVNGLKVVAVLGLFIAGLVQWLWARLFNLGWQARLWVSLLAVTAGHVTARMEGGLIEILFSIAVCSLLIPVAIQLSRTGSRRLAILLGILAGTGLLSGHGYIQIGLIFGVLPALFLLILDENWNVKPVWKEFLLSGVLAVLISAVLWLPTLHFLPNYQKDVTDPAFSGVQPISFQILNLVIDDPQYYSIDILHKTPWAGYNANFIGWIPILLAILALRFAPAALNRYLAFLLLALFLIYLTSSAEIFRFINNFTGTATLAGIRSPIFIQSLAVPLILALSALGLDALQSQLSKLKVYFGLSENINVKISLQWLILIWPLFFSIKSAYAFGQLYLHTDPLPQEYQTIYPASFQQLPSQPARWIETTVGDWTFIALAMEQGGKFTRMYHQWIWRGREFPLPEIAYTYAPMDSNTPGYKGTLGQHNIIELPENNYAYVQTTSLKIPCDAKSQGGNIDVDCETDTPGTLIVMENAWSGWGVKRDGQTVALEQGNWLSAQAPAGLHHYEFRYRPWDVMVGMGLSISGWVAAFASLFYYSKKPKTPASMEKKPE
jgi:hypothetical protein